MRNRVRFAILLPALAMASLASVPAARAQDSMVDAFMGILGLKQEDARNEIDYRERAPLVVPPKMALRAPEEPGVKRGTAWPNDPDVIRRKQKEAEAKAPRGETEGHRMEKRDRLTIEEVRAGRREGAGMQTGDLPYKSKCDNCREAHWLTPDQMRALDQKITPEETLVAGKEPDRRYLTDPPSGYRLPSSNAPLAAPRGAVVAKESDNETASPYQMYRKNKTEE
jgi:hypothetical protein